MVLFSLRGPGSPLALRNVSVSCRYSRSCCADGCRAQTGQRFLKPLDRVHAHCTASSNPTAGAPTLAARFVSLGLRIVWSQRHQQWRNIQVSALPHLGFDCSLLCTALPYLGSWSLSIRLSVLEVDQALHCGNLYLILKNQQGMPGDVPFHFPFFDAESLLSVIRWFRNLSEPIRKAIDAYSYK